MSVVEVYGADWARYRVEVYGGRYGCIWYIGVDGVDMGG